MNKQSRSPFSFRLVASAGCEIRDQTGRIVGWTVDEMWAAIIVRALNRLDDFAGGDREEEKV
jgi:hypothetical protein